MNRTKATAHRLKRVFAAASAAGVALSVGLGAVPAWAAEQPAVEPPPIASPAASPAVTSLAVASPDAVESPTSGGSGASDAQPSGTKPSEAGLREAALRDLGLTPEGFAAAGELGKQAADAAAALQEVPGYLGTRIQDGSILVAGTGAELEAAVARLSAAIPAVALEAPPSAPPSNAPTEGTDTPAATGTELAQSTQDLYQAYLRDVGTAGLQAVAYTGKKFVVRTGGTNRSEAMVPDSADNAGNSVPGSVRTSLTSPDTDAKISPAEFVARYANVELDAGAPLALQADVPGGLGYASDNGTMCSTGFSAFDPAGLPAVLTAGHCSFDGAEESATLQFQGVPAGLLGKFGFSQFGGPGNTTVLNPLDLTNPGNVGTDIAVIDELRADLDPLPAASTWGDPSEADPDVKIIGTAAPVVGQPVCRSGRTSAWSCGTIDEVGIYVVRGLNYDNDDNDLRAFNGFLSFDVQSSGGDSGGPWVSGNYAVGTHSAGDTPDENGNFAVAATLQDSLAVLPGYELELFLNKPTVTSPAPGATLGSGQTVTGTVAAAPASAVAAGSKVRITVSGQAPFEVPVDAGGAWSFTAPAVAGPLRFTARTINGFSTSGAAAFDFAPQAVTPAEPETAQPDPTGEASTPTAAVPPVGGSAAVVRPLGDSRAAGLANTGGVNLANTGAASLANTGASGLILFAGLAAGALAIGGVFLLLAKRRKRQRSTGS
jgi:streptogrisin C